MSLSIFSLRALHRAGFPIDDLLGPLVATQPSTTTRGSSSAAVTVHQRACTHTAHESATPVTIADINDRWSTLTCPCLTSHPSATDLDTLAPRAGALSTDLPEARAAVLTAHLADPDARGEVIYRAAPAIASTARAAGAMRAAAAELTGPRATELRQVTETLTEPAIDLLVDVRELWAEDADTTAPKRYALLPRSAARVPAAPDHRDPGGAAAFLTLLTSVHLTTTTQDVRWVVALIPDSRACFWWPDATMRDDLVDLGAQDPSDQPELWEAFSVAYSQHLADAIPFDPDAAHDAMRAARAILA